MRGLNRRAFLLAALGLPAVFNELTAAGEAQDLGRGARTVQGKVFGSDGKPCANAIVYLQDQKSREIKTYITPADGSYRFGQLNMDTDYQIWAKYQGTKSKTKSISSFSSKPDFVFDLKLEPSK